MEALLSIVLSVLAVASGPSPISEVVGSDKAPIVSASPGGTLRWRLPPHFPVFFGNVTLDILELNREPTGNEGHFNLVGQLMINGNILQPEIPLSLSEEELTADRVGRISVFEQVELATGNRHLVVVTDNRRNPMVFVIEPGGTYVVETVERLDPGRTEVGRLFVATSGGAADLFASREACVDALAEVENIWQMGRRRDVHPCLDTLPEKLFDLLTPSLESRQAWLDIAGLGWAIKELQYAEPRRALAVLRLAREMRPDAAGATAIDFFEAALQYPDIEVQKLALFMFERWASLYGHRTTDMVPMIPPPPLGLPRDPNIYRDPNIHIGLWQEETDRATSEFYRIRPIVEALAESADPEAALLAVHALNEGWPVGSADHWEQSILEILKARPKLRVRGWLRPADVISRDGIAQASVDQELTQLALNSADFDLAYEALRAMLHTKPPEPMARKLFVRVFSLLRDPEFSGSFDVLFALSAYPALGFEYLDVLKEMNDAAERQADQPWPFSSRANRIQQTIDALNKANRERTSTE